MLARLPSYDRVYMREYNWALHQNTVFYARQIIGCILDLEKTLTSPYVLICERFFLIRILRRIKIQGSVGNCFANSISMLFMWLVKHKQLDKNKYVAYANRIVISSTGKFVRIYNVHKYACVGGRLFGAAATISDAL